MSDKTPPENMLVDVEMANDHLLDDSDSDGDTSVNINLHDNEHYDLLGKSAVHLAHPFSLLSHNTHVHKGDD